MPDEAIALLLVIGLPFALAFYVLHHWFKMKHRKIELEAGLAAEKAAQYAVDNRMLQERVAVLEQIVTDGGAETAAQIEALRSLPVDKRELSA